MKRIIPQDMPKLESPFIRENINGDYVVTPKIAEGYEWVFEDDSVMAIEKLHGTNVSIIIEEGTITSVWNRSARIPPFNKGKDFVTRGVLNSFQRGYCDLPDGQWFGELVGPKVNGNPYNLGDWLWIPFSTYGKKNLSYKSWGKYPKTYEAISEWFKDLMPLFCMKVQGKGPEEITYPFVEGIVFTHPDGRLAKLRRDMFDWYEGKRH
jgi:hypothetical protein